MVVRHLASREKNEGTHGRNLPPYCRNERNTAKRHSSQVPGKEEARILQGESYLIHAICRRLSRPPSSSGSRLSLPTILREIHRFSQTPTVRCFLHFVSFRIDPLGSSHRDSAVIARSFFLRNKYVSRGKQEAISMGLSDQTMSAIS